VFWEAHLKEPPSLGEKDMIIYLLIRMFIELEELTHTGD